MTGAVQSAGLDVLAVGDLNADLLVTGDVTPRFGQAEQDVAAQLTLGGSAAIFAAGAARLGLRTAMAAAIGDDALGRATLGLLAARGVDTSLVRVLPESTTGLSIHLQRGEDRTMLTDRGAIAALGIDKDIERSASGARHVHLGALFLIPDLAERGGALVEAARRAGATVSVDTNFDPEERFEAPAWLTGTDVLMPNETEALALARRDDGDVLAAARALAREGALVAVKRGADGALAVRGDAVSRVQAPVLDGEAIDSVGAGDSFDAGLVRGLFDGLGLEEALALACACGTLSLRAAGGVDAQPTLAEARAIASAR